MIFRDACVFNCNMGVGATDKLSDIALYKDEGRTSVLRVRLCVLGCLLGLFVAVGLLFLVVVVGISSLSVTEVYRVVGNVGDSDHCLSKASAALGKNLSVFEVSYGLNDGLRPEDGVSRFENSGSYEHSVHAKLHHEGSVRGSGNASGSEVDNW